MYKRETRPTFVLMGGSTDFRCGIEKLMSLISESGLDPFSDSVFVFCPKRKDKLKLLYWGGAGFYLILYRLEEGKFRWLREAGPETITYRQMEWLLDGLEINPKGYISETKARLF